MADWFRLFDRNTGQDRYFLPHWYNGRLNETLQSDLMARGLRDFTLIRADQLLADHPLMLDLPGMAMVTREYVVVGLPDIKIQIPCTDVGVFLEEAQQARTRGVGPHQYVKLHGFMKCVCLTMAEQAEFIRQLTEKLDYAKAVAHAENEQFNDAMAQLPQAVVVDRATDAPKAMQEAKEEGRDVKLLIKRRATKKDVAEG